MNGSAIAAAYSEVRHATATADPEEPNRLIICCSTYILPTDVSSRRDPPQDFHMSLRDRRFKSQSWDHRCAMKTRKGDAG